VLVSCADTTGESTGGGWPEKGESPTTSKLPRRLDIPLTFPLFPLVPCCSQSRPRRAGARAAPPAVPRCAVTVRGLPGGSTCESGDTKWRASARERPRANPVARRGEKKLLCFPLFATKTIIPSRRGYGETQRTARGSLPRVAYGGEIGVGRVSPPSLSAPVPVPRYWCSPAPGGPRHCRCQILSHDARGSASLPARRGAATQRPALSPPSPATPRCAPPPRPSSPPHYPSAATPANVVVQTGAWAASESWKVQALCAHGLRQNGDAPLRGLRRAENTMPYAHHSTRSKGEVHMPGDRPGDTP